MTTIDSVRGRLKTCIIHALELEMTPEDIADDARLFGPAGENCLGLDSLAALEIVVALSQEFNIMATEVDPAVFESVNTLVNYIMIQTQGEP